jgi:hypothetical protein
MGADTGGSPTNQVHLERTCPLLIPIYGFVEGDTMGVVILVEEQETILALTNKLLEAVSLRVDVDHQYEAIYQGLVLNPDEAVVTANLRPLQRLDLKRKS